MALAWSPAALLVHALSTPQPLHILARGLDDALGVVDCVKGGYPRRHLLSVKDAHSEEVNQRNGRLSNQASAAVCHEETQCYTTRYPVKLFLLD